MYSSPQSPPFRSVALDRPLGRDEALSLARVSGSDLVSLLLAASELRDRHKGRVVTYSRKVFIPLTNLCRNRCAYCTFSRRPSDLDYRVMRPEEVLAIARAGAAARCKEALFCLGEKPEERYGEARRALTELGYPSTISYLAAMCRLVWQETGLLPHCNPGVLNEDEMRELASVSVSGGLMLESCSERLGGAGGPHFGCPGKVPAARIDTISLAGRLGLPFTTGILIGIGETPEERVDALFAICDLHQRYAHIQEVIVQNFLPHPSTRMAQCSAPSTLEMLRTLALARLILGGEMNLQAPPNLAPNVYQLYLLAGINDWGGVSPVTRDLINPDHAWPVIDELEQATATAGFALRERLAIYPEFLGRGLVGGPFRRAVESLVDDQGYVKEQSDGR